MANYNDVQARDVISQLNKTPGFSSSDPDMRNRLIQRSLQDKYGTIPPFQNVLNNISSNSSEFGPAIFSMGPAGVGTTMAGAKNVESGLPTAMQMVGNVVGSRIGLESYGHPVLGGAVGGTIGRTIGEGARQGIDAIFRGQPISGSQLGTQAGIGALTEGIGAPFAFGTNRILSGPAGEEFRNTVGEILGGLNDRIKNSGILSPVEDFTGYLRASVNHIRNNFQVDPGIANHMEGVANELESVAENKGGMLEPQDLMNAKRNLNLKLKSIGIYGNKIPKDYIEAGELADAKGVMGAGVQNIADQSGIGPAYKNANKVYSKIANDYPIESSKHRILKNILEAGGVHGLIKGDLQQAMGNTLASEAVGSQGLRTGIYNLLKAGKAAPAVAGEGISFLQSLIKNKNKS